MKQKMRKAVFGMMILLFVFVTGCSQDNKGTVTGTNYYYPEKETETQNVVQIEASNEAIKADLRAEHYMIISNDMTMEHLILQQMESGKQYLYYYSLATSFLDKYGNSTSVSYFEPGRIISIGGKDSEGRLKSAQISDDVWEYEDIVRFEIDEERGVFKIADTKYSFEEDVFVVSEGEQIKLSDVKAEDELRVIGMNKEILSVVVTTGQGTIALKNTELFEDSFIQIGNKIFAEITGEIELEVPEGTYTVTVANKGYGGSKEYEVKRNVTTVIDLDELKGEGPKMGAITFEIATGDENEDADITFKVDGKEVDFDEPIEMAYGIHSIAAEAKGYETYAKKLFVNSETATISIALDTETSSSTSSSSESSTSQETSTDTTTDLAGSLAGSTSSSSTGDTSSSTSNTDALIESLTNALTGDSSSDYISTLTELMSGLIY